MCEAQFKGPLLRFCPWSHKIKVIVDLFFMFALMTFSQVSIYQYILYTPELDKRIPYRVLIMLSTNIPVQNINTRPTEVCAVTKGTVWKH
jgi:hypothetical protein